MDFFQLSAAAIMAVMASASLQDWRRREIDDWHWWAIAAIGSARVVVSSALEGDCIAGIIGAVPFLLLFAGLMSGRRVPTWVGIAGFVVVCVHSAATGISDLR